MLHCRTREIECCLLCLELKTKWKAHDKSPCSSNGIVDSMDRWWVTRNIVELRTLWWTKNGPKAGTSNRWQRWCHGHDEKCRTDPKCALGQTWVHQCHKAASQRPAAHSESKNEFIQKIPLERLCLEQKKLLEHFRNGWQRIVYKTVVRKHGTSWYKDESNVWSWSTQVECGAKSGRYLRDTCIKSFVWTTEVSSICSVRQRQNCVQTSHGRVHRDRFEASVWSIIWNSDFTFKTHLSNLDGWEEFIPSEKWISVVKVSLSEYFKVKTKNAEKPALFDRNISKQRSGSKLIFRHVS